METSEIRLVLKYNFFLGKTASQTDWNINGVYYFNIITQNILNLSAKFSFGNLTTQMGNTVDQKQLDNDVLKTTVDQNHLKMSVDYCW